MFYQRLSSLSGYFVGYRLKQNKGNFKIKYSILWVPEIPFIKKKLFICFQLCWGFIAVCRLSLVVTGKGYSSLRCTGSSLWWLLLVQSTSSRHTGFSRGSKWVQYLWLSDSKVMGQQLQRLGLVALWPGQVESSWTRDQSHIPCIGRWILIPCATGKVL